MWEATPRRTRQALTAGPASLATASASLKNPAPGTVVRAVELERVGDATRTIGLRRAVHARPGWPQREGYCGK